MFDVPNSTQEPGCRLDQASKIHALANSWGRPIAVVLTPDNVADISVATTLPGDIAPPQDLLAEGLRRRPPPQAAGDARHDGRNPIQWYEASTAVPSSSACSAA